jgi:hypothetical protein
MEKVMRNNAAFNRLSLFILAVWSCRLAVSAEIPFDHVTIDKDGPRDPWIKIVGDINGDRFPDVIIGGRSGPLVWYAYPKWEKTVVALGGYDAVDGEVGDVDRDGDLDIVMGGVFWYENPRPEGNPKKGPWRAHKIGSHQSHDVEVADLDGDGDLDVVTRGQSGFGSNAGNRILLWGQNTPTSWSMRVIDCPHGEGLTLADMDRDGDMDMVIAGRWYENPRDIVKATWAEHVFSTAWAHGDVKVEVADINEDGRADVVLTPAEGTYRIAWFEAPSDPRAGQWPEHNIEESAEGVHSLQLADMDGDGDVDVVTARMHQYKAPHEVSIYLNEDKGTKWQKQVLSERGSHNIRVGDIGSDGDLDVIGANWSGPYQPIEMWENKGTKK